MSTPAARDTVEALLAEQMTTPRCVEIIERTVWTRGWRLQDGQTALDAVCSVTWDQGSGPTLTWLPAPERNRLRDACLDEARTILDTAGYATLRTQRALVVLRSTR